MIESEDSDEEMKSEDADMETKSEDDESDGDPIEDYGIGNISLLFLCRTIDLTYASYNYVG